MRKLLLILLALFAVFTLINALEKPGAAELKEQPQKASVNLSIDG
jgi:hypothetical protein